VQQKIERPGQVTDALVTNTSKFPARYKGDSSLSQLSILRSGQAISEHCEALGLAVKDKLRNSPRCLRLTHRLLANEALLQIALNHLGIRGQNCFIMASTQNRTGKGSEVGNDSGIGTQVAQTRMQGSRNKGYVHCDVTVESISPSSKFVPYRLAKTQKMMLHS
jgi:hypothetical protein